MAKKTEAIALAEQQLLIEPVPKRLALRDNLFQISVIGQRKYTFAGQWTAQEASIMQTVIKGFNWHLDEDDGCPIELGSIYQALEEAHDEQLYPTIDGLTINVFCRLNWHNLRITGKPLR